MLKSRKAPKSDLSEKKRRRTEELIKLNLGFCVDLYTIFLICMALAQKHTTFALKTVMLFRLFLDTTLPNISLI